MPKLPHESLSQRTAAKIKGDLAESGASSLASVSELARRYGVSRSVMAAALGILRTEDLIEFSRGSAIRIVGDTKRQPDSPRRAETLFRRLRDHIQTGHFRPGDILPKARYLAAHYGCSSHTVASVNRRLINDGYAYRHGKALHVGQPPAVSDRSRKMIGILGATAQSWYGLCEHSWVSEFGRRFVEQADHFGVRLVKAVAERMAPNPAEKVPGGLTETIFYFRKCAPQLLGVLIPVTAQRFSRHEEWLDALAQLKLPVVWFDWSGAKIDVGHKAIRCCVDERAAAQLAVDYLAQAGHHRIAYQYDENVGWERDRYEQLRSIAADHRDHPETRAFSFHSLTRWQNAAEIESDLECIYSSNLRGLRDAFAAVSAYASGIDSKWWHLDAVQQVRNETFRAVCAAAHCHLTATSQKSIVNSDIRTALGFIWESLHFYPLLNDVPVTALVIRNDASAGRYLRWFSAAGIRIPRDIALISFDNADRYSFHRLTSIDFGFGALGYQAFHAITGIVPVSVERNNMLCAKPFVVDRGSV